METPNNQSKLDRAVVRYTKGVIRWKWLVMLGSFALTMLIAMGAANLYMASDYREFFRGDNPHLIAYEELQKVYTKTDNILFVLSPKNGDVFQSDVLSAIEDLTEKSWKMPYAIRVNSVTNFQHTIAEDDDLIVADLVEYADEKTVEEIESARLVALNDPLLRDQIVSSSTHVTGVNVTLQLPGKSIMEQPEAVAYARQLATELNASNPDVEVYITGFAMLNNAFSEAGMGDMMTLVPAMYGLMLILMIFALRSVTGTLATFGVITLSIMSAMGVAGWFGVGLTPPSMSAPTIIMTLAIADSIHILVTMFHEMRNGSTKYEAIIESMRVNFLPVLLTSVTTVIGFLSMNTSEVPPITHLGNMTAAGVTMAFLFSMTFLPAFMAIVPVRIKQKEGSTGEVNFAPFANFVVNKRRPLLWISAISVVVLAAFIPKNELDDRFVDYFDESIQFRTDTDFTMNNLTGVYNLEFSVGAGETNGIADPAYLAKLDEFAIWYRQQPGVKHVNSFTDIMKRLNMNMHADDSAYYSLPTERDLAAQYLLLYEMSLPYGLDLNNQINVDKSATRLTASLGNVSAKQMVELSEAGENWLKTNAPEVMHTYGSSPSVMFSYISGKNIRSMIIGGVAALLIISFIILIAFRDIKIGIISLIPNLVPVAVGFGIWGLTNGVVNIGLSMVFGVTMGIVVDDSIHFLSKYLRARRERGLNSADAVRYAFKTVGNALIVTTVILMIGFSVLSFSSFGMNSNMGQLTAITIGMALLADFFFLPTLLMKIDGSKQEEQVSQTGELKPAYAKASS